MVVIVVLIECDFLRNDLMMIGQVHVCMCIAKNRNTKLTNPRDEFQQKTRHCNNNDSNICVNVDVNEVKIERIDSK